MNNKEKEVRFVEGLDMELGERIETNIYKLRFLSDCLSASKLVMTDAGREGCYWVLADIADDLEDAINETSM